MKLIVGLGNPGNKYENTRHNVGFMAVDCYLDSTNIRHTQEIKLQSHIFKTNDVIFAKPQTYMNLAGQSIEKILNFYQIDNVLVIHDDLDIDFGAIKIKFGGSSGGHNGLKSIDKHITNEYTRIRIGISHPKTNNTTNNANVIDYVLQKFHQKEMEALREIFEATNNAIKSFISNDSLMTLQNKYNKRILYA